MPVELIVSGTLIHGDDFEVSDGYVVVRDGRIHEVGFERVASDVSGLVCPAFVNAHTHVGDSVAKDLPYMPLDDLVRPPDGLKHRILRAALPEEIAEGIRSTLADMAATGTGHCADFRENGVQGVRLLRELAGGRATILGRATEADTVEDVLEYADGLGLSGANDIPRDALFSMAQKATDRRKIVGIHAGELNRSDVDTALELKPGFLVHMTHATGHDLRRAGDLGIPVAVCPRSNVATGVGVPPLKEMIAAGLLLGLGTDNVMINAPDMLAEMEWVSKAFLHDDVRTLRMATLDGARLLGMGDRKGSIRAGKDADLIVLDKSSNNLRCSKNLLSSLVRRARPDDISHFISGGRIWQNSSRKS
ncbi:MAG: chlorohydrolase [Methanocella sp. PtaU1.Bin125]|nr:MAG: chlorohydrolase [Methanocella sp. PtaU1.Bin125]